MSHNGVEWREKTEIQMERRVAEANETIEKQNISILTFKGYDFQNLMLEEFSFFSVFFFPFGQVSNVF